MAILVCGLRGPWLFLFVAFLVYSRFGCGGSSLWPFSVCGPLGCVHFRVWPLLVTVVIHVSIDTFHEVGGQISVSGIKKQQQKTCIVYHDGCKTSQIHMVLKNCLVPFPRYLFLCLVNVNIIIYASGPMTWSAVERYFTKHNPQP